MININRLNLFSGGTDVPFKIMIRFYSLLALVFLAVSPTAAQPRLQSDFTAEDFQARRTKIYAAIGDNLAIIQGAEDAQGDMFRQSNTFYYLSGLVIPSAYMLMDGQRRKTTLYLTHQDPIQKVNGGPKLSFEGRELVMKMTGITSDQVLAAAAVDMRKIFDEMTFSKEIYRKACEEALAFKGHFQHPVGMSVHDVGTQKHIPLEVDMVFTIDPMIWVREEKLYIRMEDVVVVTEDGVENLSANLPMEMDDLEALWREESIVQKRPALFD